MKTQIRKMGNSQGVLIPKPFLAQAGIGLEEVEIAVEDASIIIRKPQRKIREGWAQASQAIAEAEQDQLAWPEFPNEADHELQW